MNSVQLQNFIDHHPCLKKYVRGVYAINTLPEYVTIYPSAYIVNTDPIPLPGEHWVLIIIHSPYRSEFFDSLGHSAAYYGFHEFIHRNSTHVRCIEKQLQSNESDFCGLYVLFCLIMLFCNGFSLVEVYRTFTNDVKLNDHIVYNFMFEYFN